MVWFVVVPGASGSAPEAPETPTDGFGGFPGLADPPGRDLGQQELKALVCQRLHPNQRRFLPGRSMLANVIDLEQQSMMVSMLYKWPTTGLYEFAAAVPSLPQEFLLEERELLPILRHFCSAGALRAPRVPFL